MEEIKSGIYQIKNLINGKIYIGSSVNIRIRWTEHRHDLKYNKHRNLHLQRAYNKYSSEDFEFSILEYVFDKNDLIQIEQYYIDWLEPEYNICKCAGNILGFKFSEEQIKKLQGTNNHNYGKPMSEEQKKQISQSLIGRFTGDKHLNYGNPMSEEQKKAISQTLKGYTHTKQTRDKMSKSHIGIKRSDEVRQKISESHKNRRNWNSTLNKGDIVNIRHMLQNGVTLSKISEQYHISPTTVWRIKHKQTWVNVDI